jgi:cytochrome P450
MDKFVGQRSLIRRFIPESFPTPGNLRYARAVKKLDEIIYRIIRRRRESGVDEGDLLSMLLAAQDEEGNRMTDAQLRDEALTLYLAGHETTAVTLTWTLYLLSTHPEVEAKLLEELHRVLGERPPAVGDLRQLPYTERVVKESMRLFPPAYVVGREALNDFTLAGYKIPAGTQVLMSQWVIQRDPRFFAEPERFNPDRWTEEFIRKLPKYAYFPFGGGPRQCVGNAFAMMEAVLVLATIAQRFRVLFPAGKVLEPNPTFTLRPKTSPQAILQTRRA